MHHLAVFDKKENTVIMMQVENEIGMIPDARDYSDKANEEFKKPVPKELMDYLVKNKETAQSLNFMLFGKQTDSKHPVAGKKFLGKAWQPMRYLWPGIMPVMLNR